MATLAILPYQWAADLNSAFGLARKLQRRGHRLAFLCVPDAAPAVRAQGFDCTAIFQGAFPAGSVEGRDSDEAEGRVREEDGFDAVFGRIRDALVAGELERALEPIRPDALLVSSWTPWVAVAAHRTGLPVVRFSSILVSVVDSRVPPFGSHAIPRGTLLSRLGTRLSWERMFLRRRLLGTAFQIRGELRDLARACGYPFGRIDFRVETWPRLPGAELVLCPAELDFARSRAPAGARFVEAAVDLLRKEPPFPWERLSEDRPLVLCSLGSVVTFKLPRKAERVIQCFLDAMAGRPRWQGVAAVGRQLDPDGFRPPDNVVLVQEAPQVALLRRAALLVTHGGLTSVKESVLLGVPMVVVPFYFDQPGNAARVVHHGLGQRARLDALTPAELGALMDEVVTSPSCRQRAAAMSRRFAELEERSPASDLIEEVLSGAGIRSPRSDGGTPPPRRRGSPGPS